MQKDQSSMQEQLRAAEDRSAATTGRLAVQQQHMQQLLAACEPILDLVRTCSKKAVTCIASDAIFTQHNDILDYT